ncbi:all trans-polyprenyl-diphosphate synthase PDSS1-like [Ruditapes philippinarum]|uniref:all trans-polyprenyl-diphosphate synthase PDSS1-like n=1 Tax=Ruditapes philippinarum TaxID=129788 RepID=UPI00295A7609|nr:all trans-polyprenyl-diphosphate synthase PDSS1-like [Ruditapes philippinarum]
MNMANVLKNVSRQHKFLVEFTLNSSSMTSFLNFGIKRESCRHFSKLIRRVCHMKTRRSLCLAKVSSRIESVGRCLSTSTDTDPSKRTVDPYSLVETEINNITQDIKKELLTVNPELLSVAEYYFDGQGKLFRPMLIMLVAKALNFHVCNDDSLSESQLKIAMIAEMIHTASLMHDDVIDAADTRRNKPSINQVWGQRKSIIAGDYVMAKASIALAKIRDEQVVSVVSQITEDLVRGEFMQLGSKENDEERFNHYINKSFKKTASLLANSCKAVAVLGNCDEELAEAAYNYGKNIGISFQLIDDLLDFTSCDHVMGKPTAADLKLGLATAPVLYAARKYPQLNALIMRRFTHKGDIELARELVEKVNFNLNPTLVCVMDFSCF